MSSCEKCWADKEGPGDYMRLMNEREARGEVCTPEQQAGPNAGQCPSCKRWTLHGRVRAEPGDYVLTDPATGDTWPVKPDIFAATYESADSAGEKRGD